MILRRWPRQVKPAGDPGSPFFSRSSESRHAIDLSGLPSGVKNPWYFGTLGYPFRVPLLDFAQVPSKG
jgi:hypothetical protein